MWKQIEANKTGIIISLNYNDFAYIEVEKRTNNKGVLLYEVNFQINDVTNQSVVCYNINDVKTILENCKENIEDLYENVENMSDSDIYDWLDEFVEVINNF